MDEQSIMHRESIRERMKNEYYTYVIGLARKRWEREHGPAMSGEWWANVEELYKEYTTNAKLTLAEHSELLRIHKVFREVSDAVQKKGGT